MENQKQVCYNSSEKTSGEQLKDGLTCILALPLEQKRELLSVLRERRNNGLVYEKGNP